jgi:HEAT repeat protein
MAIKKSSKNQSVDSDERSHPRDIEGLIAKLDDASATARRWAARDLTEVPEAAAALVERLDQEQDVSVREAIFMSLTQIGNDIAVQGLVKCLRSEDAQIRNGAIEAMKHLPEAVAPIMANLLNDPDPDVRIFAVNILESLRHPDVEKWLIKVISSDLHINVCATAVDLLGEVGTLAAALPLEALKQRFPGDAYIEFASSLALRRIREG